ncbi:hypothetical protein [Streptomyces pacificus]|uniref:Uncharacterized protein n=1 Tax=Streptomyces pacificus TaxID=2705029 RepID=A0A6A0B370_9ACTN|nr:hypothetical protein [Streptomyces pacificus]GFH38784.1 hypothetical protein SCWH03_50400 [Streptomyces pacificus]
MLHATASPVAQPQSNHTLPTGSGCGVADTAGNAARFGRCGSGPKASAFPAHLVAVSECGTHAVIGAQVGSIREGELVRRCREP